MQIIENGHVIAKSKIFVLIVEDQLIIVAGSGSNVSVRPAQVQSARKPVGARMACPYLVQAEYLRSNYSLRKLAINLRGTSHHGRHHLFE